MWTLDPRRNLAARLLKSSRFFFIYENSPNAATKTKYRYNKNNITAAVPPNEDVDGADNKSWATASDASAARFWSLISAIEIKSRMA